MSSPPDFAALPYRKRLFALLRTQPLPNGIDLGDPDDEQLGVMTRRQLRMLSRQLWVWGHSNITSLDLSYQFFGPCGMCKLAGSIAKLTGLQELDLCCAYIFSTCCICGVWLVCEYWWGGCAIELFIPRKCGICSLVLQQMS